MLPSHDQLCRECDEALASFDATLASMPPLDPDTEEMITRPAATVAGSVNLLEAVKDRRRIVANLTHSPLPDRSHDWCAHFDGEEEAGNYGYGATREEAIADFMAQAVCDGRVTAKGSVDLLDATMSMLNRPAPMLALTMAALVARYVPVTDADAQRAIEGTNLDMVA